MMNLRQLQIFCAVMKYRTTTAAAHAIGSSQPTVSTAIRNLEDQMGLMLFERVGNRLAPTRDAKELYDDAAQLQALSDAVGQKIKDLRSGKRGHLRILSTQALSRSITAEALRRFMSTRPNLRLFFDVRPLQGVVESVESGFIEVGFAVSPPPRPNIDIIPLVTSKMVAIIPRDHPLGNLQSVSPHDLANYPVVGPEPTSGFARMVRREFDNAGIEYAPLIEVRHSTTACMLVEKGIGVAVIDEFSASPNAHWHLAIKPFSPQVPVYACAMHLSGKPLSRLACRFIDHMRSVGNEVCPSSGFLGQ